MQIANTVPVPYLQDGPIESSKTWEVVDEIKRDADKLGFDVDFDGVHLRKPMRFPNVPEISKPAEDYDVFTFREKFPFKDGSTLKFKGYIYNQRKSILPTQFRGIVVRIKNVAIGNFFQDFLDYPYSEKLWLPWTMGEIYVEEGLEEAMNIDRNTFNIAHPHYRKLKTYLHTFLHEKVFRRVRERYSTRISTERQKEESELMKLREKLLTKEFGLPFALEYDDRFEPKQPIDLNLEQRSVVIYRFHPIFAKRKQQRQFLEDVLIFFEVARLRSKGNVDKFRQVFYDEMKGW